MLFTELVPGQSFYVGDTRVLLHRKQGHMVYVSVDKVEKELYPGDAFELPGSVIMVRKKFGRRARFSIDADDSVKVSFESINK